MPDTVDTSPTDKSLEELVTEYLDEQGALLPGEHVSQVVTVVTVAESAQGGR